MASSKNSAEFADGQYRLICTDIAGARNGSGVIVNLKGEIIGIIDQSISEEDSMNLVTGFGISDIKEMMQFLLNGQGVPLHWNPGRGCHPGDRGPGYPQGRLCEGSGD